MEILKLSRSPLTWGTLVGMTLGYFGIPAYVPAYSMWVWHRPYGFHVASILILGTVGCLMGSFVHYGMRKGANRRDAMWTMATLILVLLGGTIGISEHQARNETVIWSELNTGFVRVLGAAQDNRSTFTEGIWMIKAGADIQAGADMGGVKRFGQKRYQQLTSIASAFAETGYNLLSATDKSNAQESLQFVKQAGSTIKREIGNQSYPNRTNHLNQLLSEIVSYIPPDYQRFWQAS